MRNRWQPLTCSLARCCCCCNPMPCAARRCSACSVLSIAPPPPSLRHRPVCLAWRWTNGRYRALPCQLALCWRVSGVQCGQRTGRAASAHHSPPCLAVSRCVLPRNETKRHKIWIARYGAVHCVRSVSLSVRPSAAANQSVNRSVVGSIVRSSGVDVD